MISRRKIISRSLDNLDEIGGADFEDEEEDIWYDQNKLFRDHLNELLGKWEQIDDEIWSKIIIFEKNRRVAKAYARSSVITINGSKNGFDGVRIGLNGFQNPMRDQETKNVKKSIGDGFKIKMDDTGNVLIKRYGKNNVFVHNTSLADEETVIGADIIQLPGMSLKTGVPSKLFDMRKFTTNMNREFSRSYPEKNRLERQCLSAVSLVKTNRDLIYSPLWILIINVVAVDMLRNRFQYFNSKSRDSIGANSLRTIPSIHIEDPYSTIDKESQVGLVCNTHSSSDDSNKSSKSQRHMPIMALKFHEDGPYVPKPDYEHEKPRRSDVAPATAKGLSTRKKQDDPYYCGLLARIPNFIKSSKPSKTKKEYSKKSRKLSASQQIFPNTHLQPIPIATFHQYPAHAEFYQRRLSQHNSHLSQSQLSLWDTRSLISARE